MEFTFTCSLPTGLHARPASHLADFAGKFTSECLLTNLRSGLGANVKSVLAIIGADVRHGDECSIRVIGADEEAACGALRYFVERDLPSSENRSAELVPNGAERVLPRSLRQAAVDCHFGISASRGIGRGRVVVLSNHALPRTLTQEGNEGPEREHKKVERAIDGVRTRIEATLAHTGSATEAAILKA